MNATPQKKDKSTRSLESAEKLSAQLSAMLAVISGEGFASFNGLNDVEKDNYIWCLWDIASNLKKHVNAIR